MNNFDLWNNEKQTIDKKTQPSVYINVREIWYTKMGKNIGFEENGKKEFVRPVLVIKKIGNLFLTIALTSKGKDLHYLYHKFIEAHFLDGYEQKANSSYVILSQIKVMDKKRFEEKMGYISENEFKVVQKKLKNIIF